MKHWLMKSEPSVYSIDDLARDKKTLWEGVRNYQARNFMVKDMKPGDEFIFYHSNAEPSCAAGIGRVTKVGVPDPSALDKKSEYHDAKATAQNPIWFCVEVEFLEKFAQAQTLDDLRTVKALSNMLLLKRGQRLYIQPVTTDEFRTVCKMGRE